MEILLLILLGLIFLLVLFLYSACVLSSRISQREEIKNVKKEK